MTLDFAFFFLAWETTVSDFVFWEIPLGEDTIGRDGNGMDGWEDGKGGILILEER